MLWSPRVDLPDDASERVATAKRRRPKPEPARGCKSCGVGAPTYGADPEISCSAWMRRPGWTSRRSTVWKSRNWKSGRRADQEGSGNAAGCGVSLIGRAVGADAEPPLRCHRASHSWCVNAGRHL